MIMKIRKALNIIVLIPFVLFLVTLLLSFILKCDFWPLGDPVICNMPIIGSIFSPIITFLYWFVTILSFAGILWIIPALIFVIENFIHDKKELKSKWLPFKHMFKKIWFYSFVIYLLFIVGIFIVYPLVIYIYVSNEEKVRESYYDTKTVDEYVVTDDDEFHKNIEEKEKLQFTVERQENENDKIYLLRVKAIALKNQSPEYCDYSLIGYTIADINTCIKPVIINNYSKSCEAGVIDDCIIWKALEEDNIDICNESTDPDYCKLSLENFFLE